MGEKRLRRSEEIPFLSQNKIRNVGGSFDHSIRGKYRPDFVLIVSDVRSESDVDRSKTYRPNICYLFRLRRCTHQASLQISPRIRPYRGSVGPIFGLLNLNGDEGQFGVIGARRKPDSECFRPKFFQSLRVFDDPRSTRKGYILVF
jgi:hypothetical protein